MTNDECRRNDEVRMTKRCSSFLHSCFFRHSSFVLRHFRYTMRRDAHSCRADSLGLCLIGFVFRVLLKVSYAGSCLSTAH